MSKSDNVTVQIYVQFKTVGQKINGRSIADNDERKCGTHG